MPGNGHHYKPPAEVTSNLRQRPFSWFTPDFGRKIAKFWTNFGKDLFFLVFIRIAAALRLRQDSTAEASSTHATFHSLTGACKQHQTKSNSNFKF